MKKFEYYFLKYGHWSFLFSSLFEAGEGRWFTAATFMFYLLIINLFANNETIMVFFSGLVWSL
jgi:hypothetical protein